MRLLRWNAVPAGALAITALVACLPGSPEKAMIYGITHVAPDRLELEVAACALRGIDVDVDEGPEEAVLTALVPPPPSGPRGDCAAVTAGVELSDPLGDRTVIDGSTGGRVTFDRQ